MDIGPCCSFDAILGFVCCCAGLRACSHTVVDGSAEVKTSFLKWEEEKLIPRAFQWINPSALALLLEHERVAQGGPRSKVQNR